jgi:hypothetical protein
MEIPMSDDPLKFKCEKDPQEEFTIDFLNNKRQNRNAFYVSLLTFLSLVIAFAVFVKYSANTYTIIGLIISVIGVFVSMIRISLSELGLAHSTTRFLRTIVFLWECYLGITAFLLFVQNIIVVGMIVVMAVTVIAITWYKVQVRYGKEVVSRAKKMFENDSDEGEAL